MKTLKGKTAVITGAASGFGLETARLCAAAGMNIVMADVQQEYEFGREFLRSARRQTPALNDPLLEEYVANLTYKLAATSELTDHRLAFLMIDSDVLLTGDKALVGTHLAEHAMGLLLAIPGTFLVYIARQMRNSFSHLLVRLENFARRTPPAIERA